MRSVGWLLTALTLIASTAQAATVEVGVGRDDGHVAYLRYFPETVVVHAGDTVTWNAASNTPHTVTAQPAGGPPAFDSTPALMQNDPALGEWFGPGGFLLPGQSFNRTFDRSGTFTYFCKIHPGMVGTIVVTNATSAQAGGSTGLPLPGGEVNRNVTEPGVYHVAAGWGSGDVSADMFGPAAIVIPVGSTVMWTNFHTAEPHTVTATPSGGPPAWDSSPKVTGEPVWWNAANGMMSLNGLNKRFSHTFDTPGHFVYFCKIHPGMVGTVAVLEKPMANHTDNTTGPGTNQNQNRASGSTVPGLEAPLLVLGLAGAALVARRRRV